MKSRIGSYSIILLGAALLLFSEQHRGILQALSAAQPSLRTGQVVRDRMKIGTDGPEMIVIPAGKFRMGDIQGRGLNVEQPVHEVHIRRPFAVSRYEITFNQYDEFAKTSGQLPDDEGFGRGRRPVIRVSWNERLSMLRGYRSKRASTIGCRPRPNGNMLHAAEQTLSIGGATR